MRRAGNLWPDIVSFDALRRAAQRAALGKRRVAGVARFLADLEPEILRLQRELSDGSWRPGPAYQFEIHDPKRRTITAAPFADRVVHHALIDRLEPVFDRRMIATSFACRQGKGTHAALDHARGLLRRHAWFLKLDIERCFDSLDHEVVLGTLARVVKDRRVLALCETIVRHGPRSQAAGGTGLPIGNLTSQWFCNLVLDQLDHHVAEVLRVPGYVRYMDDFVLFADDKPALRAAHGAVAAFLADTLHLRLKASATLLAPARHGLPFLGWNSHRGTTRLRPENLRRMRQRVKQRLLQHRRGQLDTDRLAAGLRSVVEHLRHGSTLGLRRAWLVPLALDALDASHDAPPRRA